MTFFTCSMDLSVTPCTQRNQVPLRIVSARAAKLSMMHFQVRHGSAALASPTIPSQHLLPKSFVRDWIKPQAVSLSA